MNLFEPYKQKQAFSFDSMVLQSAELFSSLLESSNFSHDSAGVFFRDQLTHVFKQVFEYDYVDLNGLKVLPVSKDVAPGSRKFQYRIIQRYGKAHVAGFESTDAPRGGTSSEQGGGNVIVLEDSFSYNTQDIRSSALSGHNLDSFELSSSIRRFAELENELIWYGLMQDGELVKDSSGGDLMPGLLNLSDIDIYAPVQNGNENGGIASRLFKHKTPDQILDDHITWCTRRRYDTKHITRYYPQEICYDTQTYDWLAGKKISQYESKTILEWLQEKLRVYGVTKLSSFIELDKGGTSGHPRIMMLSEPSTRAKIVIPMAVNYLPAQRIRRKIEFTGEQEFGGLMNPYPKFVTFIEGHSDGTFTFP